jgi:hypothetical protein
MGCFIPSYPEVEPMAKAIGPRTNRRICADELKSCLSYVKTPFVKCGCST